MNKENTVVLTTSLEENLLLLRELFVYSEDFVVDYTSFENEDAFLVYIESIVDKKLIEDKIVRPILNSNASGEHLTFSHAFIKETSSIKEITKFLLEGNCVLLKKKNDLATIYQAQVFNERDVNEPHTEQVIRGAHEGFVEGIKTNIHLKGGISIYRNATIRICKNYRNWNN